MKKLSDLHSSLRLLAVCLKPPRRYPETDRPASEASGCRKAPLWGIAAAPASSFLKNSKLGYHREASWIKSVFP